MERDTVKEELMTIIKPFVPDGESISLDDNQDLINDLKINSAHICLLYTSDAADD